MTTMPESRPARSPRAWILAAAALALGASPLAAQWPRDEVTAERSGAAPAAGAARVRVEAGAGTLRVEGREGITEVRARGIARATSRGLLEDIRLTVRRAGDDVLVRAEMPEDLDDGQYAGLDLVVELPKTIALRVSDGSGDAEIKGVKSLDIQDGSGGLRVNDIGGPLMLTDGSGELRIVDVRGDVELEDGSGSIELRQVRGSVVVDDGSGSLDVSDVTGTVRVRSKGSGSVEAVRVGGDFVVERRTSGTVDYREVKGRVDVPERRRRGRDW
jgi:hypothetical protein